MIRKAGYILLVGGFAATVFMCVQVSMVTYNSWIWHTKNLPAEDQIPRSTASAAMRDISLESNHLVRRMLWPALVTLAGGLMIGSRRRTNEAQHPPAN
jgi:hypothetical protein